MHVHLEHATLQAALHLGALVIGAQSASMRQPHLGGCLAVARVLARCLLVGAIMFCARLSNSKLFTNSSSRKTFVSLRLMTSGHNYITCRVFFFELNNLRKRIVRRQKCFAFCLRYLEGRMHTIYLGARFVALYCIATLVY